MSNSVLPLAVSRSSGTSSILQPPGQTTARLFSRMCQQLQASNWPPAIRAGPLQAMSQHMSGMPQTIRTRWCCISFQR